MTLAEQLKENQDIQFEQKMAMHTLVGNLTNWRDNFKNNSAKNKVLVGRMKIFNLLARFKV